MDVATKIALSDLHWPIHNMFHQSEDSPGALAVSFRGCLPFPSVYCAALTLDPPDSYTARPLFRARRGGVKRPDQ